jgi:hypothetical protein
MSTTCDFTVTVEDTEGPEITDCAADVEVLLIQTVKVSYRI